MATIQEVLSRERQNSRIDVEALANFIYTPDGVNEMKQISNYENEPFDFNAFNLSRSDLIKMSVKELMGKTNQQIRIKNDQMAYLLKSNVQLPLSIHSSMFVKCIQMLGTQRQQQTWYLKAKNCQIYGCYAQTQLGHGSDVRNLQTTATYNMQNDTFTINTPSISATKCWPGDLGIYATHALVFAQMIVQGKNHGVHSFIVPIRDLQTFEPLPGIQVGDIGPKFGFHTKDNGYLIMKNIVIPKTNMLRKFTSVSKTGQIKKKGDPKVSYATMMIIRQLLSTAMPKIYAKAIIIATRYSIFRTQFLTSEKIQIPIIDYQSQKDKIITRVAQFVAISIGGTAVKNISNKNLKQVVENNNFSLMAETHSCLCLGKAMFSEIAYDGMEICRKACGGHGFSQYSGIPMLLAEYAANLTLEGQNTILYLQVTRYLLKNYKYAMTKKQKVGESVQYLLKYDDFMSNRIDADRQNWKNWTLQDIQFILSQAACYSLSLVLNKMLNKPQNLSNLDVWNKVAGIDIKKAAVCHGHVYAFTYFKKAIENDTCATNREVIKNLCMLFGASNIIKYATPIIEGGFITPEQISALRNFKELLLEHLRPHIISITDAFLIPEQFIQSALTQGDPYENYLNLARKNSMNSKVQDAALLVKKEIVQATLKHQAKL